MRILTAFCMLVFCGSLHLSAQPQEVRLGLSLGHTDRLTDACYSNNGKFIATASADKLIKIWDAESGKLLRTLSGHEGWVNTVKFSTDDALLTSTSNDNTLKIWDVETGALLHSLAGHSSAVYFSEFNKSSDYVLSTSADEVFVWDVKTGAVLQKFESNTENRLFQIFVARFTADGRSIIILNEKEKTIWDVKSGKMVFKYLDADEYIFTDFRNNTGPIVFNAKRSLYATFSFEKINVWDFKSEHVLLSLTAAQIPGCTNIRAVDLSSDGSKLLILTQDSALVYNLATSTFSKKIGLTNEYLTGAKFSPDGKKIALLFTDITGIWNSETLQNTTIILPEKGSLDSDVEPTFSRDGKSIVVPGLVFPFVADSETGLLRFYLGGFAREFKLYRSAYFSPNNKQVLTSSDFVRVMDLANGKVSKQSAWDNYAAARYSKNAMFTHHYSFTHNTLEIRDSNLEYAILLDSVTAYCIATNEKQFLIAKTNGSIELIDLQTRSLLHTYKIHGDKINSIKFSHNDSMFVSTSNDKLCRVINLNSHKIVLNIECTGELYAADFSPNDSLVYMSANDATFVYNLKTGALLNSFNSYGSEYANYCTDVLFTPDASHLLVEQERKDIFAGYFLTLYEIATGQEVFKLDIGSNYFINQLISADGKYIIASSSDNIIRVWDAKTGIKKHELLGHYAKISSINLSENGKFLLSSSYDGSIILWDFETGKMLLQTFLLVNNNFISIHPSGLFDATPGAMDFMYWIKGMEIIDFAQLKDRYWEPGLWEKAMSGKPLRSVQGLNQIKSAPKVSFGTIKNGKLPLTLTKQDGGYGKVVVYINGKEVLADARGGDVLNPAKATHLLNINLSGNPLLQPGKANIITVKAWTEDGFVEGRGAELVYEMEGDVTINEPSLYAVICGVSEYTGSTINLQYAVPDALAISKAIQLGGENLFGKERTHIYTLTSPGTTLPTKANITKTLEEISKIAKPEDILIVYLSGHGVTWGGDFGDFYYLTYDAFSSSSEAFNDPAIRENTTISTHEFTERIKKIPALKQVMIIDACGSGKAVENLIAMRNVDASQIKAIDRMKDRTGMFIISGCAADAVSYEASRYGQGLLTYSLLQAMKGAALKENKFVDVNTLLSYAREQVPIMAQGIGGIQTPQLLVPQSGSFDIGILYEENQKSIPLSSPKPVFVRSSFINVEESEDNLSIANFMDDQLVLISAKGAEAELIFVDAKQYPEGCKASGTYTKTTEGWQLKGKLKCGDAVNTFELNANTETELKEKLIARVLELLP